MSAIPQPIAINNAVHFHQARNAQPGSRVIHDNWELVELVTSGEGAVWHHEQWIDVDAGSLIWHAPGDHTIGKSNPTDPYRCLAVIFEIPNHPGERRVPRFSRWERLDEVRDFTRRVVRSFVDETFDRQALLSYAFGQLLFQARRWHHGAPDPEAPPGLTRALERIESDFSKPLVVSDLADDAGWSSSHLHAVFRDHLGMSPHQALIQRRLRAVREQLTASDAPVKRIAVDCGFRDAAALCRTFRQAAGTTPAAYRRRHAHPPTAG